MCLNSNFNIHSINIENFNKDNILNLDNIQTINIEIYCFIISSIIQFCSNIFVEYDFLAVNLDDFSEANLHYNYNEFEHFASNQIINKADWSSSHIARSLTDHDFNPFLGKINNETQALSFKQSIKERFININDPNGNNTSSGTTLNLERQVVEDYICVYKPEGIHTLRIFEESRGIRLHIHEGFRPANSSLEKAVQHIEKEFNPLPYLKEPFGDYLKVPMPDGLPIKFDPTWSPEMKEKYWLATECNKRSISEKYLADAYEKYKNNVQWINKDMHNEILKREKMFLFNRDRFFLELKDLIRNN